MNRVVCALAGIAGSVVLTTCCPSLYLTVTKVDGQSRPAVPRPQIADKPIRPPPLVQNRLDVFDRGLRTSGTGDFMEIPADLEPGDDLVSTAARALEGRDRIAARVAALTGDRPPPGEPNKLFDPVGDAPRCASARVVSCEARGCRNLRFDAALPIATPVVVKLKGTGEERVVETCEPVDPALAPTPPPGDSDPAVPCNATWKAATRMRLAAPITARQDAAVEICMSARLDLVRTLFSFVHLSDVQLRDGDVTLEDRDLSHRLDWLISSFEYDNDLQFYNQYMAEAVLATVDKEVARYDPGADPSSAARAPAFVIHTGDAIDAGTMGELARFHKLIDRLSIPFYDVLGNHDMLVFGNLLPLTDKTRNSDAECASIASVIGHSSRWLPGKLCVDQIVRCEHCVGNEAELVARPLQADTREHFIGALQHAGYDAVPQLGGVANRPYCTVAVDGLRTQEIRSEPLSRTHGFDLNETTVLGDDKLHYRAAGYYAFAAPLTINGKAAHALFIALNGEDLGDGQGGITARLGPQQVAWLKQVLACVDAARYPDHAHDLVFAFAHQPLSLIQLDGGESLETILRSAGSNFIGFFYGHNHEHAICGDYQANGRRTTCQHFWEVETGSLIEFPQEGRVVRIKQIGTRLAYLDLTTFGERLEKPSGEFAQLVMRARRGAERDFCRTHREARCTEDLRPYRSDGHDTHGRLFFWLP